MTGQRLKDIFESHYFLTVGGSLEEAWVKSMKQAVNEAIEAYRKQCEDNSFSDGKTEFILMDDINRIAEKLKIK